MFSNLRFAVRFPPGAWLSIGGVAADFCTADWIGAVVV